MLDLLPQRYGVENVLYRANMPLLADLGFNVLQEFWWKSGERSSFNGRQLR